MSSVSATAPLRVSRCVSSVTCMALSLTRERMRLASSFQLGDGVFDHDGLDAVLAEHAGEVVVELPLCHRVLPLLLLRFQLDLLL